MVEQLRRHPITWLLLGLMAGLLISFTRAPVHAVATDRHENFVICTGPVDTDVEAVYFLDHLTGDLTGAVLSTQSGKFNTLYRHNILNDLKVDPSKNPRYLMVTGQANLRRGASRLRPALSCVYVAELTTGRIAAYTIPWSPERHNSGEPYVGQFHVLDVGTFRGAAVRE
jgi:hypothetical protein